MPDENGETRRQRNERFSTPDDPIISPDADVPESVQHVWEWFWELSPHRHSGPEPLTWGELEAWARMTRKQLLSEEVGMLMAMDRAYVSESRKEISDQQTRQRERTKGK